jgi:transposase-like protein
MHVEIDSLYRVPYGQSNVERVNPRNGYRSWRWDTRGGGGGGRIDLAIPRLRKGSYYQERLLDPHRRSEQSLVQVVTEC